MPVLHSFSACVLSLPCMCFIPSLAARVLFLIFFKCDEYMKKYDQFGRVPLKSKIHGTPKGVYLPILKLHSILAVTNLLVHNNITYYRQINLIRLKSNVNSEWTSKHY